MKKPVRCSSTGRATTYPMKRKAMADLTAFAVHPNREDFTNPVEYLDTLIDYGRAYVAAACENPEVKALVDTLTGHCLSSTTPVVFHLDGTIPVDTIRPAQPPQNVDYRHGGYYLIEYVGGGTAEAYGDQLLVMAGAA